MLSTSEAAKVLGVSKRRVRSLIDGGQLKAERVGSTWAIEEDSVAARAASKPKAGRPSAFSDPENSRYTLMCRNDEVLDFIYNHATKQVLKVDNPKALELAPIGACYSPEKVSAQTLGSWISERYIPTNRIGLTHVLREAGVADPAELMFKSLGLNLTDQYWFKPAGMADLDWCKINYFENPYTGDRHGTGPGSGTPGMLEKWWEWRDGMSYLIKAGSHGEREPFAEVAASKMYERVLDPGDFVSYEIEYIDGKPHSVCPSFVEPNMQLVTLRDIFSCYAKPTGEPYDARRLISICEKLGVENARQQLSKLIVCDFLDANIDRHDMNLGLLRNVDTLKFESMAPIFDNGRCFFFEAQRKSDFGGGIFFHTSHPFSEYPSVQLALVYDYSWFDENALDGLAEEIEEILSQNELAPKWFGKAASNQFERQLDRVIEAKRERSR